MDLEEITRSCYALVDADDLEGVLAWFAHDAVYYRPGYKLIEGTEALRSFYGGRRIIASGTHRLDEIKLAGPSVAVRGRLEGILKDGPTASIGFADFLRYNSVGRVTERRTFFEAPGV